MFSTTQLDDGSTIMDEKGMDRRTACIYDKHAFFNPNYKQRVTFFDDFLGDLLKDEYSGNSGADGADPVIVAGTDGIVNLVSGAGATSAAANASSLTLGLNFIPSDGYCFMKARVKISALTGAHLFIGFTDVLASTTCEIPFTMATATLTDNASDAVGFFYDDDATSVNFQVAATKADTEQSGDTGVAADTAYHDFLVEIDASGHARMYLDDVFVFGLANAVTAATALTPAIVGSVAASGSATTTTADYIFAGKDRAA